VLERLRVLYAAEVAMTDHWLGKLLERLRRLSLERDTVIVLVSDHGVQLGEHGWVGKISTALHSELINVPLVIVDPRGRQAGARTSYFTSTHDLAPTILAMAGVAVPTDMEGADLSRLFSGRTPPKRSFAYGGWSDSHYLRSDRWAYISDNGFQRPQLYDLAEDVHEARDVAAQHPDVVRELAGLVRERAGGSLPVYAG
jgi:arylsulfatase A-like enzyme